MFSVYRRNMKNRFLFLSSTCPLIVGFLIDVSDCYTWPFFIAGIVLHVAGLVPLVLFCLKEKTRKDDDLKNDKIRKPLL